MTGVRYVSAWDNGLRNLGGHWIKEGGRSESDTLNHLMEIDHVIRVDKDGMVHDDVSGVYAPEIECGTDKDGQILAVHERGMVDYLNRQGWTSQGGWSGQQGTTSVNVIMHTSEFIGGNLAERVLTTSGLWVACVVEVDGMDCVEGNADCTLFDQCADCTDRGRERDAAGWLLLHQEVSQ